MEVIGHDHNAAETASFDDCPQEHPPEAEPCDRVEEARRAAVVEVTNNVRVDWGAWSILTRASRVIARQSVLAGLKTRFPD
jgi:hypothetical protein